MARLKKHSKECNLRNITHKEVILLIATMHCNKEELRKDVKCYANPSWLAVEQQAENYECSMINKEPHKAGQVKKNAGKKSNQRKIPKHPHMKGKCRVCGSTSHRSSKCKLEKNSTCSKCVKLGHLAKVCLSTEVNDDTLADKNKSPQTGSSIKANTEQTETCHTVNMSHDYNDTDVPTALLWLCKENDKSFQIKATADKGCSVTITQTKIEKIKTPLAALSIGTKNECIRQSKCHCHSKQPDRKDRHISQLRPWRGHAMENLTFKEIQTNSQMISKHDNTANTKMSEIGDIAINIWFGRILWKHTTWQTQPQTNERGTLENLFETKSNTKSNLNTPE